MLRIVKLRHPKPSIEKKTETSKKKEIRPSVPVIESWIVKFHLPSDDTHVPTEYGLEKEIGTIQITQIRWNKLPLPKHAKHHVPNKLKKWFSLVLNKKYHISDSDFHFIDTHNTYFNILTDTTTTSIPLEFIYDTYFIPLFTNTKEDLHILSNMNTLPNLLKIEITRNYDRLSST